MDRLVFNVPGRGARCKWFWCGVLAAPSLLCAVVGGCCFLLPHLERVGLKPMAFLPRGELREIAIVPHVGGIFTYVVDGALVLVSSRAGAWAQYEEAQRRIAFLHGVIAGVRPAPANRQDLDPQVQLMYWETISRVAVHYCDMQLELVPVLMRVGQPPGWDGTWAARFGSLCGSPTCMIPIWLVGAAVSLGVLPAGVAICRLVRRRRRQRQNKCGQCGYLLRGLPGARCPECGTPVPGAPKGDAGSCGAGG